jgi:hypothetical protein
MCTVTVVPHAQGVRLLCNRDERRTRAAALPPRIHDVGLHLAVFPTDPQGGGTWIGVNDADVIVALLNAQAERRPGLPHRSTRSRGLIVRELLRCVSLQQAIAAAENLDPRAFEPFRVVMVHNGRVAVARNDGTASIQCTDGRLDRPLLFTSSSLGDAAVGPPRRRLFERVVLRHRAGWLEGQARFHHHRWVRRPEISIRMERRDALTVSRTRVDINNDGRQVVYEAPVNVAGPDRVHKWCSWR